ncbi:MAG: hypothetical protein A2X86_11585 [Bdellovibrionales bacterium GWA2_49_15]|nr:MAG: hypothetical protein A2X86_11585 [Bdellovibrionales bacterium GWA2_49_15]
MKLITFCIIMMSACFNVGAVVGTGGYSPFGPTTQKAADGETNTFSFHPMFVLNSAYPLFAGHLFTPQLGLVLHRNKFDENEKKTVFILMDVAYILHPMFILRYGMGSFLTKVGGNGGNILLDNGNETTAFAKPDHTVTSYNTTLNFGCEFAVNRNYSLQTEAFAFSLFDSHARAVSYLLALNYYLD